MLSQYGPDLLMQCEAALELSKEVVEAWLRTYMFGQQENGPDRAKEIAAVLADHKRFKSHSRHIPRDQAEQLGLNVFRLEDDEEMQDLALSVFHATTHTFSGSGATKIVEPLGPRIHQALRPTASANYTARGTSGNPNVRSRLNLAPAPLPGGLVATGANGR